MTATRATARRLLADDEGATAIEYALLAAFIAVAIIASVIQLGETLDGMYGGVNSELVEHMPPVE
jgi:pilus assembly protein Flp/PilA